MLATKSYHFNVGSHCALILVDLVIGSSLAVAPVGEVMLKEFIETQSEESHLKGASIALLVIVGICSLIVLSIVLLTPSARHSEFNNDIIEINEIVANEFEPRLFNGTWISGHEFIYKSEDNTIVLFDANHQNSSILVHNYITSQYNPQSYSLSSDRTFILLISSYKKTQDLTISAQFVVYGITNGDIVHLEDVIPDKDKVVLQWAEWAPIGNALALIHNNDIYYMPYIGAKVKAITNSGKSAIVFNGVPDLLYRDAISRSSLLWWSKEGRSLCYATIDNSDVVDNTLVIYGGRENRTDSDSIRFVSYRYPKAKQRISNISLTVHNLNSNSTKQIIPPKVLLNKEFYLTHVNWVKEDLLTVVWTLRNQSNSIISRCSEGSGGRQWMCSEDIIKFRSGLSLKELSKSIVHSADGLKYFVVCLRADAKIGSYYHISLFRLDGKFAESFITFGRFDVTKLVFYDQLSQFIYFRAKQSIIVEKQHIYRVKTNDSKSVECLSCQLASSDCLDFEAVFSTTADHFILECLGPDVPKVYLFRLSDRSNKTLQLEDNEWLTNKMKTKLKLTQQFFTVITDNKIDYMTNGLIVRSINPEVHIRLLLPIDFDDEVIGKYPLIIEASDPRQSVFKHTFHIDWSYNLVSEYQYIYGWVASDDEQRRHTKREHNYQSIIESIDNYRIAVNYIKRKLLFIDSRRMCIWGSTIGAFISLSTLSQTDAIGCALLISPVVNWRLIDAPTFDYLFSGNSYENYAVFEGFTLDNKINKLMAKHILLIHGSADEIVSIQHSMQLIRQTVRHGMQAKTHWNASQPVIQLQLYPDEDHSLASVRHHMFKTIQSFFGQTFAQTIRNDIKSP